MKPHRKHTPKCDKSETSQRVTEIVGLKTQGYTRTYILQYATKKWGIGEDRVDQLIGIATIQIKEINLTTIQDDLANITHNLWVLFRQASTVSNVSEQHKILMSIAKLKGLEQHTINHVIEDKRDLAGMSDEELDKLMSDSARLDS